MNDMCKKSIRFETKARTSTNDNSHQQGNDQVGTLDSSINFNLSVQLISKEWNGFNFAFPSLRQPIRNRLLNVLYAAKTIEHNFSIKCALVEHMVRLVTILDNVWINYGCQEVYYSGSDSCDGRMVHMNDANTQIKFWCQLHSGFCPLLWP